MADSFISPHISDPPGEGGGGQPGPMGPMGPSGPAGEGPPIAMLAIPKSWNRLVGATVGLLFLVVALVAFMVYLNFRTVEANRARIETLQLKVRDLETKQAQGEKE